MRRRKHRRGFTHALTGQGIAAFNDYYCEEALAQFNTKNDLPTPTIVAQVNCLKDAP